MSRCCAAGDEDGVDVDAPSGTLSRTAAVVPYHTTGSKFEVSCVYIDVFFAPATESAVIATT